MPSLLQKCSFTSPSKRYCQRIWWAVVYPCPKITQQKGGDLESMSLSLQRSPRNELSVTLGMLLSLSNLHNEGLVSWSFEVLFTFKINKFLLINHNFITRALSRSFFVVRTERHLRSHCFSFTKRVIFLHVHKFCRSKFNSLLILLWKCYISQSFENMNSIFW